MAVSGYINYTTEGSYGGWDHSARPNWLSFLRAQSGNMPTDPKNTVPNTANAMSAGNTVYAYFCYPATSTNSIGYPDSAAVTMHYRNEAGATISDRFLVEACLATLP